MALFCGWIPPRRGWGDRELGEWANLSPCWRREKRSSTLAAKLISPGFVDTHLHGPQLEMIGSYGGHLLEWLNRHTFPTESRFADATHARTVARALYTELLRNGTVTALIFSSIHATATDVFFEEAEEGTSARSSGKP